MLAMHEREAPSSRRYTLARLCFIPVVFRSSRFFGNYLCFMHVTHAGDIGLRAHVFVCSGELERFVLDSFVGEANRKNESWQEKKR